MVRVPKSPGFTSLDFGNIPGTPRDPHPGLGTDRRRRERGRKEYLPIPYTRNGLKGVRHPNRIPPLINVTGGPPTLPW